MGDVECVPVQCSLVVLFRLQARLATVFAWSPTRKLVLELFRSPCVFIFGRRLHEQARSVGHELLCGLANGVFVFVGDRKPIVLCVLGRLSTQERRVELASVHRAPRNRRAPGHEFWIVVLLSVRKVARRLGNGKSGAKEGCVFVADTKTKQSQPLVAELHAQAQRHWYDLFFDLCFEQQSIIVWHRFLPTCGELCEARGFGGHLDEHGRARVFATELPELPLSREHPQWIVNLCAQRAAKVCAARSCLQALPGDHGGFSEVSVGHSD